MIIDLTKSKLFTMDPDIRFAEQHSLPVGLWKEMWKRYKLLAYTPRELCEYYEMKTAKKCDTKKIHRWIMRTEIYCITQPIMKRGAVHVNTSIFGQFEQFVIDELTKQMRFSGHGDPKVIV